MQSLGLFAGYGVEIEYALVDARTLSALPVADRLLAALARTRTRTRTQARSGDGARDGAAEPWPCDVDLGTVAASNELVLHVIELKTPGPAPALAGLADAFQAGVAEIEQALDGLGGRLLPTAMHPWFDPAAETRLWSHEAKEIYRAYDRIFGCRGHGWSNLQSTHLNLPFSGDDELGRLHAAIRLVLPLIPALAASSPIVEGRPTGLADSRLEAYRTNSRRFASITGRVIPEPVYTRSDYEARILAPIYRDLAPFDPEGILCHEFSNARGAIARFERGSIEIRLIDTQEAPRADLAVLAAVAGAVRLLVDERWSRRAEQAAWPVDPLAALLSRTIAEAERAAIDDPAYLAAFGVSAPPPVAAGDLWRHLVAGAGAAGALDTAAFGAELGVILDRGPLARRILQATGPAPTHDRLHDVYARLADCLHEGEMFRP